MLQQIERFLFNFNRAYSYTFIAGILVSFAVNLLTTALLTKDLLICVYRVYGIALSSLISAIGAFWISAILENARSEWESSGAPSDPEVTRDFIEKRKRVGWMWFFFIIIVFGILSSIFLYCF